MELLMAERIRFEASNVVALAWSREGFCIVLFTANDVDIHNHIHTAFVPPTNLTALGE
jgi:hypothetical protein